MNVPITDNPMLLPGTSSATVLQALQYNTTNSGYFNGFGAEGNLTYSQVGYTDAETGQTFQGDPTISSSLPSWAAAVTLGGSAIVLAQSFYGQPSAIQNIDLIHELLHLAFGGGIAGGDVANAQRFGLTVPSGLTGDALVQAAGNAMNAWLQSDCGANK